MLFFPLDHGSLEISILPPMKREFLVKLNREFESNPLRQPVLHFLCLGVLPEISILRLVLSSNWPLGVPVLLPTMYVSPLTIGYRDS